MIRFAVAVMLCAGCSAPKAPRERARYDWLCGPGAPRGTPAQLTIAPGASSGPQIDPPQFCGSDASIRVHGAGTRTIVTKRIAGCDALPADAAACPEVSILIFGRAVLDALQARIGGERASGIGIAACEKHSRFGLRVNDWADADQAIRVVDEELRRWSMGSDYYVSITGIGCARPL